LLFEQNDKAFRIGPCSSIQDESVEKSSNVFNCTPRFESNPPGIGSSKMPHFPRNSEEICSKNRSPLFSGIKVTRWGWRISSLTGRRAPITSKEKTCSTSAPSRFNSTKLLLVAKKSYKWADRNIRTDKHFGQGITNRVARWFVFKPKTQIPNISWPQGWTLYP
jgi:hypothetical protein